MKEDFQIDIYETDKGRFPFIEWESELARKDRAIISTRLARIR